MKTNKDKGRKPEKGTDNVKKKREKCVSPKKKRMKVNRRNCDKVFMDESDKPVNSNDCDEETHKTMPGNSSSIDYNSATTIEQYQHPNKRKNKAAVPLPRKKWKRFDSKDENEDWIPQSEEDENNFNLTSSDPTNGSDFEQEECGPRLVKIANNVWRRLDVPGDGNCLPSSIAVLSGQGVGKNKKMRQSIVKAATEELWDEDIKQQILTEHFSGPEYQDKTDDEIKQLYKCKMGTPGTYGSDLEILVAGRILPTAFSYIQLYSNLEPNQKPYRVCNVDPNSEKPRKWMFYSGDYVNGLGHWEPLEPIGHIEPLENGMYYDAERTVDCKEENEVFGPKGLDEQLNWNEKITGDVRCGDCGKCFTIKQNLYKHIRDIHRIDPANGRPLPSQEWKCKDCGKDFTIKDHLHQHIRNKHLKDPVSGKPLPKQEWKCKDCGKVIKNKQNLYKHIRDIHRKDPATGKPLPLEEWKCKDCDKCFKTKCLLNSHTRSVHVKDPATGQSLVSQDWSCKDCGKCFKTKALLHHHIRHVHEKDPVTGQKLDSQEWKCTDCEKFFKTKNSLHMHVRHVHLKNPATRKLLPFVERKCKICGKSYKDKDHLHMHIRDIHRKDPATGKPLPSKEWKCKDCGESFKTKYLLNIHTSSVHVEYPPTGQVFQCNDCKKCFAKQVFLQKHIRNVHRIDPANGKPLPFQDWSCKDCVRSFKSKTLLHKHIRDIHRIDPATGRPLPSQNWPCKDCGNCFRTKTLLHRHNREVHSKDPITGAPLPLTVYTCAECGKSFRNKSKLLLHSRHIHSKDLLTGMIISQEHLTCCFCQKVFDTEWAKRHHITCTHHKDPISLKDIVKGEHKCSLCHKVFPYLSSLKCHMQQWHVPSIKLRCEKCKIQFKTRGGLLLHKKKNQCAFSRIRAHDSHRYACKNGNCSRYFPSEAALKIHMSYHRRILLTNRNLGSLPPLLGLCRAKFCGTRKCGKGCAACDHIILRREVTLGKKTFVAKNPYSCKSVGVIYAITCAHPGCKTFYIGMTVNALRNRFRGHLSSCINGKKRKLYNHFRNVHHPADMMVEVLYQEKFDSKGLWKDRLRAMEGQYIKDTEAVKHLNSVNGLLNGKALLDS